ncbi:MAG: YciI family protein [Pseudomonadota bacterium]
MTGPRITKHDILEKTHEMLQKQLYVINTRPTNGLGPVMENIGPHLEFQVRIEQEGIMFAAGPLWADDEETWEGEGMVIIRADSLDHARQIAESDPMHASGARTFTVRPWLINEGGFSLRVTFSDGRRVLD